MKDDCGYVWDNFTGMVRAATPEMLERIRKAEMEYLESSKRHKQRKKLGNIGTAMELPHFRPIDDADRIEYVVCSYCDKKVKMASAGKDHIIPKSVGGSGESENKIWCCRLCNQAKSNLLPHDWLTILNYRIEQFNDGLDRRRKKNLERILTHLPLIQDKLFIKDHKHRHYHKGQDIKRRLFGR